MQIQRKKAAEILRNEDHFHTVVNGAPIMLWMSDAKGNFIFNNERWLDFTGLSENEITGKSWAQHLHPEDQQYAMDNFFAAHNKPQEFKLEYRLRRFDDTYRWLMDHAVPRVSSDGTFLGFIGYCTDITEHNESESSLGIAKFTMDHATDSVYLVMSDGHFFYANNAACKMIGYSREELLSMRVHDINPNLTDEIWSSIWNRRKVEKTFIFEAQHHTKDGLILPVEIRTNYIEFEGAEYSCAIVHDITERKQVEENLKFTQFAIDNFSDAAIWIAEDGSFVYVNNAACQSLDYSKEELLDMSIWDIDPDFSRDGWADYWQRTKHINATTIEARHRKKDGTSYPVNVWTNHLVYQGKEVRCTFARDISERKEAEKNLNIYRQIVEASKDFWSFVDNDFVYRYVNDVYSHAFKKPKQEIIGLTLAEVLGKDYFDREIKKYLDECMSGKHVQYESCLEFPGFDSGYRNYFIKLNPVYDTDGKISGIAINAHDITAQKELEKALRENQRVLATLMDNLTGIVYRCKNDENWTMEFMNEGTLALTGYSAEEFTSGRIQFGQIIHPDDRQPVWDKVQAALQKRLPFEMEYRINHADGKERWFWEQGRGVLDANGQLAGLEGFITDITDRKLAEEMLQNAHTGLEKRVEERTEELLAINKILEKEIRQREQTEVILRRYEHITSTTSELMTFVDRNYTYLAANQSYLDAFGKTQAEVVGQNVIEVSGHEFFNTILKPNIDRCLQGSEVQTEIWSAFPGMKKRCYEMFFDPHKSKDGQVEGVVITSHDITEHKSLEKVLRKAKADAEAANLAKSRFLANMSHELRTPLNAIIGYSELLKETAKSEQRVQDLADLEHIHVAGKHLLSIITDILDLAKIEAGKLELAPEQFDIAALLDSVVSSVMPLIKQNGNTLTVQCGETLKSMYTDEVRLRQCLVNLLSNAAKFTKGGEITLSARHEQRAGKEWCSFQVSDTGIGMSTDQLAKVMQPFAQADSSTTRKYGGTGLGLAITCELVGMLGGLINVESSPGKGSSFTLSFPREKVSMPGQDEM